jgi:hypothetical protein
MLNWRWLVTLSTMGARFKNKNVELEEMQSRIQATNRAYFSILSLVKSRGISRRVRVTLYIQNTDP